MPSSSKQREGEHFLNLSIVLMKSDLKLELRWGLIWKYKAISTMLAASSFIILSNEALFSVVSSRSLFLTLKSKWSFWISSSQLRWKSIFGNEYELPWCAEKLEDSLSFLAWNSILMCCMSKNGEIFDLMVSICLVNYWFWRISSIISLWSFFHI